MKTPWLIQRCELGEGRLKYDYMGSSEFKVGDRVESLKRIFAKGLETGSTTINFQAGEMSFSTSGGSTSQSTYRQHTDVRVYMVAGKGFSFAAYRPYLQQLAEHKLRLQEWTSFDDVVKAQVGVKTNRGFSTRTNVWFDFQNDVLWTLTEDNLKALVSVLEGVKQAWAPKGK